MKKLLAVLFIFCVAAAGVAQDPRTEIIVRDSTTLAFYITQAEADPNKEFKINITDSISYKTDDTIPANMMVRFNRDGAIAFASGDTLTWNAGIDAGLRQIFVGGGTIQFEVGSVKEILPQWFGAKGDSSNDDTAALQAAFNSAFNGSMLYLPRGIYVTTSTITTTKRVHLRGEGTHSVIKNTGSDHALVYNGIGDSMLGIALEDFTIWGGASSKDGLRLHHVFKSVIKNVHIASGAGAGIYLAGCIFDTFIDVVVSNGGTMVSGTDVPFAYGFVLRDSVSIESNDNVFIGCTAENCTNGTGIGLDIDDGATLNTFINFTSEGNDVGMNFAANCPPQVFINAWLETNTTDFTGSYTKQTIIGYNPETTYIPYNNVIAGMTHLVEDHDGMVLLDIDGYVKGYGFQAALDSKVNSRGTIEVSDFSAGQDNYDNSITSCTLLGNQDAISDSNDCLKVTATATATIRFRKNNTNFDDGVGLVNGNQYIISFDYYTTSTNISDVKIFDSGTTDQFSGFTGTTSNAWGTNTYKGIWNGGDAHIKFFVYGIQSGEIIYFKNVKIYPVSIIDIASNRTNPALSITNSGGPAIKIGANGEGTTEIDWGTGTFTTTAEADTVLISGAAATDLYLLSPKGTAADPQDVLFWEAKEDTLIVHRPAAGTSGLVFSWWRFK